MLRRWLAVGAAGSAAAAGGLLAPAVNYGVTGAFVTALVAADFDNDGDTDLAASTTSYPGRISVLLNYGDGAFAPAIVHSFGSPAPADPTDMATGDFDDDGDVDLVVASAGIPYVPVLLGNGDGTFTGVPCCLTPEAGGSPQSVAVDDVDGDGNADFVVSLTATKLLVFAGRGNGNFSKPVKLFGLPNPRAVALGDVDDDGDPDLVLTSFSPNFASMFRNDDGVFAPPDMYTTGATPGDLALGDIDDDGHLDLVTANRGDSSATVRFGVGGGIFGGRVPVPTGGNAESVALADLNGDGLLDLVFANRPLDSNNVGIVAARPNRKFTGPQTYTAGTEPAFVVATDLDGDGHPDVAAGNQQSATVSVLLNTR